ncbi:MAG: hypothetical protein ACI9KN_002550 [Gammaproteobacteria bacterium]|jgi:hypothetical protein
MSEELFEVAFCGEVSDSADLDNVKARVGKMFNADDAKIAQLFSGKRIVIKKNIDRKTADKYLNTLMRAGAVAKVKPMITVAAKSPIADIPKPIEASKPVPEPRTEAGAEESAASGGTDFTIPPKTDPLGITGDQIEALNVTIAPVGSVIQDQLKSVETPTFDLSGIEVAPVGSELGRAKKEADQPPPDTSGLSLVDN